MLPKLKIKIEEEVKKNVFLYGINMRCRAFLVKRRYSNLRTYYEKIAIKRGIKYQEEDVPNQVSKLLKQRGIHPRPLSKGNLRIFYIGAVPRQDYGGIIQGLQKFGQVIPFECEPGRYGQMPRILTKNRPKKNGQRLLEMVRKSNKDGLVNVVIGQMWAHSMDPLSLRSVQEMGIITVNISMDDRHTFQERQKAGHRLGTSGLIGSIDLACTAAKECCLWYQMEGCPSIYLPEASDPEIYRPGSDTKLYDVCFVGANYGIRSRIVKTIEKRGIKVTCYGVGWPNGPIDVKKLPNLFARSRIILGVGSIGHCTDFYSLKMRDFDGPMSGSLYITHNNPDLSDLYEIGKEIVTYRQPEECADKVVYYLHHPKEAISVGRAGRIRAEREHTWEKRFDKIFRTVEIIQ
ncbi:MAG TPA: hypothetical protein ENH85_04175 [Candidatus Scalindua sp.]|nr:hypothetical protein [Candidatus Scalindua sp.]